MLTSRRGIPVLALSFLLAPLAPPALADDVFYRIPVARLTLVEGAWPEAGPDNSPRWDRLDVLRPYAALDGPGQAYVLTEDEERSDQTNQWSPPWTRETGVLVVKAPGAPTTTAWIFVPNSDWTGLVPLHVSIQASDAAPEASHAFYTAKALHYERLQLSGAPGAAWFRRQALEARRALGPETSDPTQGRPLPPGRDLDDTYSLFTGGRALAENLQLPRDLPPSARPPAGGAPPEPEEMVQVATIQGITVPEMDWTAPAGSTAPRLDPLANHIPADQHAVFFPSFDALATMLDETNDDALPIFRSLAPRSEDAGITRRYERQLCLSTKGLARLLGPLAVRSVAITGSDPYFPSGTDVAVLLETADPKALAPVLLAQITAAARAVPSATPQSGDIGSLHYDGAASPDRAISSYVAVLPDAVVVTNSLIQLKRLGAVQASAGTASTGSPAIAGLPEYRFFRSRYPVGGVGAEGENAFVFLSDATIRRWCGPAWRIGASRRVRAAAIMADLTSANVDEVFRGTGAAHLTSEIPMRTIGTLTLGTGGVTSSVYGTPSFLTPIAELGITEVTRSESDAYGRWRAGYERNWRWSFDPIGISLGVGPGRLSADLTVMPLIVGSDYREWINAARGASIAPDAGDPHGSIAHAVFAINAKSNAVQQAAGLGRMMAPGLDIDPLGWLGESIALYADPDPFWNEMLAAPDDGKYFENNAQRLPIALYAQSSSALKLTAFVTSVRAFIDQSSPGMMAWETRQHGDQGYVRVGLSAAGLNQAQGEGFDKLAVYYAAMPRALIVSLNEDVLKRAIDRELARRTGDARPATPNTPGARPWLGSSLCLQFSHEGLDLVQGTGGSLYRSLAQHQAWANISVLNEWKGRYPDKDPIQVHQALWNTQLLCPGGGGYEWNERYKTMTSTVYGCPGEPKPGPPGLGALSAIKSGNLGLTFEERGLRAKVEIDREAKR